MRARTTGLVNEDLTNLRELADAHTRVQYRHHQDMWTHTCFGPDTGAEIGDDKWGPDHLTRLTREPVWQVRTDG